MIPPSPTTPPARYISPSSSPRFPNFTPHRRTPSSPSPAPSLPPCPNTTTTTTTTRHAPRSSLSSSMVLVSPSEWVPDWFPPSSRTPPSPPATKTLAGAGGATTPGGGRMSYLQRLASPAAMYRKESAVPCFRVRGLDLEAVGCGKAKRVVGWMGRWVRFVGESAVWLFFDFTTAYILVLLAIARPRPFALGPAIYLAVFLAWVILAISHLQLWYSVWRQKAPPISEVYLNPYSHLLTSLISPSHHAFLAHLSHSDRLTHAAHRLTQTYASTLFVLPRATLALMLVLGGTNQSFLGMNIDEGLYFAVEDARLTTYAVVVLLVFLGATAVRVGLLVMAWLWMRRVEGPRRKKMVRAKKVQEAGYAMGGWRERLDERIQETYDACLTGPWPDNDPTLRRSASSRHISQLGRTASMQPLASLPETPTRPDPRRTSNLRQVYPTATSSDRRSGPMTGRLPPYASASGAALVQPTPTPLSASAPATPGSLWDSSRADRGAPAERRAPYPFPPSPSPSPPFPFATPSVSTRRASAQTPGPIPGPSSPFDEYPPILDEEAPMPPPPLPPPPPPPGTPTHLTAPRASVPTISLLSASPVPSRSTASSLEDQERNRRDSSRTFGRQTPDSPPPPPSPLPLPPTRGKWSDASSDAGASSVGRTSDESHGRVGEVLGRGTMMRPNIVFGARGGGGAGGGIRRERRSVEESHPRASTEPLDSGRHRPSSLLVPESERTGRRSITLEP